MRLFACLVAIAFLGPVAALAADGAPLDPVTPVQCGPAPAGAPCDYTIEVASRIPDEVLDSIRKEGGALRLKFRLKDDGVLLGWDIERPGGGISRYSMAGGDFREAYIFNGKVVDPGWYIDKNGQKIETDFK